MVLYEKHPSSFFHNYLNDDFEERCKLPQRGLGRRTSRN